jgi:hypothetical protein
MADALNFSAFNPTERPAQIAEATAAGKVIRCGWIPPHERTAAQNRVDAAIQATMPRFSLRGRFTAAERRYPLWKAGKQLLGKFLPYNWQQTGSCVGAGGGNMAKTAMAVEIVLKGENEEYKELWWPFTYGRSRFRGGLKGKGEGSFGSAWAEAAIKDGTFEIDPAGLPDLPDFKIDDNWIIQPAGIEMDWSDGGKIGEQWLTVGRTHLFKTAARMKSKEECFEAIANGYPLTQASSFGFRNPKIKGAKFPIRVAEWNGTWHHQTWIDETWDHEELSGVYFRWGNNWGPDAHGAPTGDEPPGGIYIHESLMDRLCREGEVYAFSGYNGFPARELNFSAF